MFLKNYPLNNLSTVKERVFILKIEVGINSKKHSISSACKKSQEFENGI